MTSLNSIFHGSVNKKNSFINATDQKTHNETYDDISRDLIRQVTRHDKTSHERLPPSFCFSAQKSATSKEESSLLSYAKYEEFLIKEKIFLLLPLAGMILSKDSEDTGE